LIFEAYEQFGAQFRFVRDALDFSFIVVQMHRSLAKFEKKAEKMVWLIKQLKNYKKKIYEDFRLYFGTQKLGLGFEPAPRQIIFFVLDNTFMNF
jgi:hypothetical protein